MLENHHTHCSFEMERSKGMKVLDKRTWEQLTSYMTTVQIYLITEQYLREVEKVSFAYNINHYLKPLALT